MSAAPRLSLAPGVTVQPVRDLAPIFRKQLEDRLDAFAVTARQTRQTTCLVDAAGAELLDEFRQPSTIEQAVRRYAARRGEPDLEVLEQAWSMLETLMRRKLLVKEGEEAERMARAWLPGDRLRADSGPGEGAGEWTVIREIRRFLDTQIFLARGAEGQVGVVKVRPHPGDGVLVQREADILRALDGRLAPRLLETGKLDGGSFLITEFCAGVLAETYARRLRTGHGPAGDRAALFDLAVRLVEAYAELHRLGVVHTDVHPDNLLVGRRRRLWLLDFERSGFTHEAEIAGGAGVCYYRPPEIARAVLADRRPLASERSEQFSVAALVYRLVTGFHYRDFDLEKEAQLRQSAEAGMRPFRHRDVADWPALERCLEKALAARPEDRFEDLPQFAGALRRAGPEATEGSTAAPRSAAMATSALAQAKERLVACFEPTGPWWRDGLRSPTASFQNGATGVAWAACRLAQLEDDPHLLALARLWIERARESMGDVDAFTATDLELTPARVGLSTPHHCESGVHAIRAMLALALGERTVQEAAVSAFLESTDRRSHGWDLTLGRASALAPGALLLEGLGSGPVAEALRKRGEALVEELWQTLAQQPEIPFSSFDNLGMAHGWAGYLFATLRWRQAAPGGLPEGFAERLAEWAELAQPDGRGVRWRWHAGSAAGDDPSMAGWCNGTAGHLLLACAAAREVDAEYLRLAESAAFDVWDDGNHSTSLCCGLIGRAYALLSLYRAGGGDVWRRRALALAETAAGVGRFDAAPPYSLFKGELALAVLASDLDRAEDSAFPLLESEGW